MHDDLWDHAQKEEFEKTEREAEIGPIVTVFHHFKAVTFQVDLPIKVHLVKRFHWNPVLARIFYPVILIVKMKIVLHRPARVPSLFIFSRRYRGSDCPECHQNRECSKNCEK
jgi:hypothetical protein